MSLDSIVNVSIENTTASVTRQGFGIPLILGYHTRFAERIRFYSDTAGMLDDGFLTTDFEYKAASACLAQNPRPTRVAVGRRLLAPTWSVDLTPIAANTYTYSVVIGTETASFTSDASATVAEITAGLTSAINALTGAFTAVDGTTKVTVTADAAGTNFILEIGGIFGDDQLKVKDVSADAGIATDLADMLNASTDWYAIVLCERGALEIAAAAAWVETNKRLLVAASMDTHIHTSATDDIATTLKTAAYARTSVFYHSKHHQFPEAALYGQMLPKDPGSATWAYKTLAGVSADTFTSTEIVNMEGKYALHYYTLGGVNITRTGQTASGEWIDITLGLDWLKARLQERIYGLLVSLDKIPYTQVGLDLVAAEIEAQLAEGVRQNLLAPLEEGQGAHMPDLDDISDGDKAARLLPDVTFDATLAGAIHDLEISGKVSV